MADNRDYLTRFEENGTVNIALDVVAAIAAEAMNEIEGVGSMSQNVTEQLAGKKAVRGVRVEDLGDEVVIDLFLMVRYGFAIPEVAQKVQESVSNAVGGMTGLTVKKVNVNVGGISFND